jgi:hypothetical protein
VCGCAGKRRASKDVTLLKLEAKPGEKISQQVQLAWLANGT